MDVDPFAGCAGVAVVAEALRRRVPRRHERLVLTTALNYVARKSAFTWYRLNPSGALTFFMSSVQTPFLRWFWFVCWFLAPRFATTESKGSNWREATR